MAAKINNKRWVEENKPLFHELLGKKVSVVLNDKILTSDATLTDVYPVRVGDLDNAPEKRDDGNGKMYTPPCFGLRFDVGDLVFVIEDTSIKITISGRKIIIGNNVVEVNFAV